MAISYLRGQPRLGLFSSLLRVPPVPVESAHAHRYHHCVRKLHSTAMLGGKSPRKNNDATTQTNESRPVLAKLEKFKQFFHLQQEQPQDPSIACAQGRKVTVHGFLSKRRDVNAKTAFVDLIVTDGPALQFMSSWEIEGSPQHKTHMELKAITAWSPVSLTGTIQNDFNRCASITKPLNRDVTKTRFELTLTAIHPLNAFPTDIIISEGAKFPPNLRHLELRFDQTLQDRLALREWITRTAEQRLLRERFHKMETPLLFKSTPEGAREFLVPTRRKGYAYALPQSPQQYKQMLMAAGVRRYYQFARCFRDEDLRADRQPEFTQLDLEMAFATGANVMFEVERILKDILRGLRSNWRLLEANGPTAPIPRTRYASTDQKRLENWPVESGKCAIRRITYHEAMTKYGSDKPDLRIPGQIQRIDTLLSPPFVSMITHLDKPIVEACVFRFQLVPVTSTTQSTSNFIVSLWDNLPQMLSANPHGQPVPLIINSSKPLSGLSSLGHEAATALLYNDKPDLALEEGNVLIIQARPNAPFSGGSTSLGVLRSLIYQRAVEEGLLPYDPSLHFLWVTEFPLFTLNDDLSLGGKTGFSSTHHPFTAPLSPEDFDLLATDPLRVKADHYDLVVNGVEVGGGSRRIHVAEVQEYVLREVLQMTEESISQFKHVLEALRAGCPPHAGFAFGWDRLAAVLSNTSSVRDVITFPKNKKGEEPVAKAPGKVGDENWRIYNLQTIPR